MRWQQSLETTAELATQVLSAARAAGSQDPWAVWDDPGVQAAAAALRADLERSGKVAELCEAADSLRAAHAELCARLGGSPADQDLIRLGILSAAAYALSAQAMTQAASLREVVEYTVRQLLPWLLRAAELGLLVAGKAPPAPAQPDLDLVSLAIVTGSCPACQAPMRRRWDPRDGGLASGQPLVNWCCSENPDHVSADGMLNADFVAAMRRRVRQLVGYAPADPQPQPGPSPAGAGGTSDRRGQLLPFPAPRDARAEASRDLRQLADRVDSGATRGVVILEFSEGDMQNRWWVSGNVTSDAVVINLERVKRDLLS